MLKNLRISVVVVVNLLFLFSYVALVFDSLFLTRVVFVVIVVALLLLIYCCCLLLLLNC